MRQSQIVLGVTALTLGILSVVPGIRATEPSKVDTNNNNVDEPLTLDIPLQPACPFRRLRTLP